MRKKVIRLRGSVEIALFYLVLWQSRLKYQTNSTRNNIAAAFHKSFCVLDSGETGMSGCSKKICRSDGASESYTHTHTLARGERLRGFDEIAVRIRRETWTQYQSLCLKERLQPSVESRPGPTACRRSYRRVWSKLPPLGESAVGCADPCTTRISANTTKAKWNKD